MLVEQYRNHDIHHDVDDGYFHTNGLAPVGYFATIQDARDDIDHEIAMDWAHNPECGTVCQINGAVWQF